MKRIIIIIGTGLSFVFFCSIIVLHIWIGTSVKEKISIAKQHYPGSAEDALIAFLLDTNNSAHDRTHIAIWTLGQIKSEKAYPILEKLYENDPKGKTCYGRHDSVVCQYEIYKAMASIEKWWFVSHAGLNK